MMRQDADFIALLEELNALTDDRHATLSEWARSPAWHPVLMICEGWQGKLAREAYKARETDLASATVGRAWWDAKPELGRASIHRILEINPEPGAFFASMPFRVMRYDEQDWIGGAVGFVAGGPYWTHLDISDVVLWSPRTHETRLWGDAKGERALIGADAEMDSPVVYADGFNFFKAWAALRLASRHQPEREGGYLPGVLAVGGLHQRWSALRVETLLAGPGVDKNQLGRAVMASARLPGVKEASFARV